MYFNKMVLSYIPDRNAYNILPYTLPLNINGYVPFLINTLDTIVRGRKYTK